jgi:glycerol uptake facilitator protein
VAGEFAWEMVPSYVLAQMIGAMLGATIVWLVYKNHFDATKDGDTKKAVFLYSTCNTAHGFLT